MDMHDWTFLGLAYAWRESKAVVETAEPSGDVYRIEVLGLVELTLPHREEWGPSQHILHLKEPLTRSDGLMELTIEMQSGDVIRLLATEVKLPELPKSQAYPFQLPIRRNDADPSG